MTGRREMLSWMVKGQGDYAFGGREGIGREEEEAEKRKYCGR